MRVLIVVNKWWECDPVIAALISGNTKPSNTPSSGVTQKRPCRVTSKPAMLGAQDRSSDRGAGSLSWHGQCLERNEAAAGNCAGAARLVAAAY